jgi:hypothetical protein
MSTAARTLAALCLTGTLLGAAAASPPPISASRDASRTLVTPSQVGGTCGAAAVRKQTQSVMAVRRLQVEGCSEVPAPPDARPKLFHHLRYHQRFPADRAAVVDAMRRSGELSPAEASFLVDRLPDRRFSTGADVLRAVFPASPGRLLTALAPRPTPTLAQR